MWHMTIYGCKKIKFVVIPCLKMLSDSSLLTTFKLSNQDLLKLSPNFPFQIPQLSYFPYISSVLKNLYYSLSFRCPVLLCLMPMLILFYSWVYFHSLARIFHLCIIPFCLSKFQSPFKPYFTFSFKLVLFPPVSFNPHSSLYFSQALNLAWC